MMKEIIEEEKYLVKDQFVMWMEQGMVYSEFNSNCTITIATIQDFINARNEISSGQLLPFLINLDNIVAVHFNTLVFLSQQIDETSSICKALYATSQKGKILSKIIASQCNNTIITKDFDSALDARDWIENFKFYKS